MRTTRSIFSILSIALAWTNVSWAGKRDIAVVILLGVFKRECRSGGNKLSSVRSFIILLSGEGLTSFCINNRTNFFGEKNLNWGDKQNSMQSMGMAKDIMLSLTWGTDHHNSLLGNSELIFVSDKIRAKCPQNRTMNQTKFAYILGGNGKNFKLKHRKSHNSILSGRFGDPYGRPGVWCRSIRERWHVCYNVKVPNFTLCRGREHKTTSYFSFPELW